MRGLRTQKGCEASSSLRNQDRWAVPRVDGIVGNSKRGRHSTALAEASAEQAFWKSTEHMFL